MMAVALFALLLVGYFTREKWLPFFQKDEVSPSNGVGQGGNTPPSTTANSNTVDKTRVLKQGDRGEAVKELQRLLNGKHKSNPPQVIPLLVEDGIFGTKTEIMLLKWTGKTAISINQLIIELAK